MRPLPGAPSASPARRVAGGGHILVVEDDPAIREVLAELLAGEGHRVTVGVDGAAVAAARADPRTRRAPIVFVPATPAALLRHRLGGCAYEGLIRKPFAIEEVLATLARVLAA